MMAAKKNFNSMNSFWRKKGRKMDDKSWAKHAPGLSFSIPNWKIIQRMEEMKTDNLLFAELYGSSILTMDSNFNIEWFMVLLSNQKALFYFFVHTFYALLFYYLFFFLWMFQTSFFCCCFFCFAVSEHRIGKIFEKLSTRDFKRYTIEMCECGYGDPLFIFFFDYHLK